ncbi:MAG: hypothetical protein EA358_05860 [Flavobacteriales bacterium]|nr:MAG: hypothetical protein EA358_05860 [Flavobacteriales bacterium]
MLELLFNNLLTLSLGLAFFIFISPILFRSVLDKTQIASIVITIGILGTFGGVFLGLLNFDTDNITESIPDLIRGLKTAFITSIAGLFTNLLLRIFPGAYGFKRSISDNKSENLAEEIIASMNKVANAISGEGESSMVTQLQKVRTTNMDGFEKMNKSFETFAERVVSDNTQSLIDALTQVMRDFNTQINEQFGDNFVKLNDGIGAMLEWQKEYKSQVEILTEQFTKVTESVKAIDKSLKSTSKSSESIYETNEILKQTLMELSSTVGSLSELGEKAKQSFPAIEKNMESLTRTSSQFIKNSLGDIEDRYSDMSDTQKKLMESYRANIEKMITDNAERVQKLDAALGDELNKSLESLGKNLTSLSKHFVNDYKPLTDKLKEVVQLANKLN